MAQTTVTFRMDEQLKEAFNALCEELGMNMTTAYMIFTKQMLREQQIPFNVSMEPFYSKTNMDYLNKVIGDIESGKSELTEHGLIEVD